MWQVGHVTFPFVFAERDAQPCRCQAPRVMVVWQMGRVSADWKKWLNSSHLPRVRIQPVTPG